MTERLPKCLRTLINLIIVLAAFIGWPLGYFMGQDSMSSEAIEIPSGSTDTSERVGRKWVHPVSDGVSQGRVANAGMIQQQSKENNQT